MLKSEKEKIARELWARISKRSEEVVNLKQDGSGEGIKKIAKRLNLTFQYFQNSSINFSKEFNTAFTELYYKGFQASLRDRSDLRELFRLKKNFEEKIQQVIRETETETSPLGIINLNVKDLNLHSGTGDNVVDKKNVFENKESFVSKFFWHLIIALIVAVTAGLILQHLNGS